MSDELAVWHHLELPHVVRELKSDGQRGLTEQEARRRLAEHGPNSLPEQRATPAGRLLLAQFTSLLVLTLIAAAFVSAALGEWVDAAAIVAIVVLNALLGFAQEYRADRALIALRSLDVAIARVVRDGALRDLPAADLAPGDLVMVEAGDHVPADARLLSTAALRTSEAPLTGESTPVSKRSDIILSRDTALADRRNMVFHGTHIASGKGAALVVATGARTELGQIASLVRDTARQPTPLQLRLDQLGRGLLGLSVGVVALVFVIGLLRGEPWLELLLTAISLAVAAIPEGLPALVTVALAIGVTRMARRHALIRRLPAVETLGAATVICTDKTGTLTRGEMTVARLYLGARDFEVTGDGYQFGGEIRNGHAQLEVAERDAIARMLEAAVLASDAQISRGADAWQLLGDPTEGAILIAAEKAGVDTTGVQLCPRLAEVPFDSERRMMSVLRARDTHRTLYVKGAPDVVIPRCTLRHADQGQTVCLTDEDRRAMLETSARFSGDGLRVLAVAARRMAPSEAAEPIEQIEHHLAFLGLVAMKDPLRAEAAAAVRACHDAGVQTVLITGDHPKTAIAIARDTGIWCEGDRVIAGPEIDRMSDEALVAATPQATVYGRVSAAHKLRIVRAWRARGAIVAMTGDGVNDAPALREAHIGVAMGRSGTAVAREASDLVLTDDNFASLVAAIEEGRVIHANIRRAIHYLLSCNSSEILVMLFAAIGGLPLPLVPVQILWLNLVTDGLPALALAMEPETPDLMHRAPRAPGESLLEPARLRLIARQGLFLAIGTLAAFTLSLRASGGDVAIARGTAFTALVWSQLVHAMNCRSQTYSIWRLGLTTNRALLGAIVIPALLQVAVISLPVLEPIFRTAPLTAFDWTLAGLAGLAPLAGVELEKAWRNRRHRT